MTEVSRREILGGLVASGVSVALASQSVVAQAATQDLATGAGFLGEHKPRPLAFDPKKLPGLSEKLLTSHWENNYGGGVKALNAIEKKLASAVKDKDLTPNMYGALKREHLARTGTVVLHEYYFGNLGGDGKASGPVAAELKKWFGDMTTWEEDFRKTSLSLAGGSGWVILGYSLHTGAIANYWSWDHCHNAPTAIPLMVFDMYEHAFHMDYGAAAAKYLDAFMANLNWDAVNARWEKVQKAAEALKGIV